MTCSIRKAVQGDEQRICELFIEMLQTIYHTEDVQGYEPGYLDTVIDVSVHMSQDLAHRG